MNRTKTVLLGASALVAGAIIAGGVNLATAATGGDDNGPRAYGYGPFGRFGGHDGDGRGPGMMGGHVHTEVSGSEKTKVADAVTAKYDDVTVKTVMKDPDGSYDVFGTQGSDRTPVMLQVSKDLKTIELRAGGPGGPGGRGFGPGGPGMMHDHTPVTGAERTKVVDAVTEKYDDVKVLMVVKDEDGSYDVMGTQGDAPVRIEVSKDLETIELSTGGPGRGFGHGRGPGGPGGYGPPPGFGGPEGGAEAPATPSSDI